MDRVDDDCMTALMLAAQARHSEIVHSLLQSHSTDMQGVCGMTASMQAAREGHVEIVQAFLSETTAKIMTATREVDPLKEPLLQPQRVPSRSPPVRDPQVLGFRVLGGRHTAQVRAQKRAVGGIRSLDNIGS